MSAIILMPDQNEPKLSHQRPCSSATMSMALKSSGVRDSTTSPRWVHVPEPPLGLVATKIADRFEPNVEAE
ncbi:hypothetical protein SAMN04488074_102173 [Lentzea albidocapillata subsp. violacea]|uniref:Uncharacterized protein n=1 Tax=Lentzea albidocapillata subsp. violacea TaxID=128104 RepID=A0A1G8U3G2_9PSEU|nr:hypothetical protein SAMN04488074_102173 [Lentzea albidocapillata subsp. violacea]